jgi:hypothetical protein
MIFILILLTSCAHVEKSIETWDTENTIAEVVWSGLHYVDYRQTIAGPVKQPDRYYEINTWGIGKRPDRNDVDKFFVLAQIAHPIVSVLTPENVEVFNFNVPVRLMWQGFSIGSKATVVYWNYQLGVRF